MPLCAASSLRLIGRNPLIVSAAIKNAFAVPSLLRDLRDLRVQKVLP